MKKYSVPFYKTGRLALNLTLLLSNERTAGYRINNFFTGFLLEMKNQRELIVLSIVGCLK